MLTVQHGRHLLGRSLLAARGLIKVRLDEEMRMRSTTVNVLLSEASFTKTKNRLRFLVGTLISIYSRQSHLQPRIELADNCMHK